MLKQYSTLVLPEGTKSSRVLTINKTICLLGQGIHTRDKANLCNELRDSCSAEVVSERQRKTQLSSHTHAIISGLPNA